MSLTITAPRPQVTPGSVKYLKRANGKVEKQFRYNCGELPIMYKSEQQVRVCARRTCTLIGCVDGLANGHVRMGVGFARIRLACESLRIANPHQRCTVPTPRRKCLWHGDSHNIKKACESLSISRESAWLANPCETRVRITACG